MLQRLKSLLESSSIPGVPNLIRNSFISIKILWILSLLVLMAWCGVFLSDTITSYLDFEIITNIDVIREYSSEFPTISFCVKTPDSKPAALADILLSCNFDLNKCNETDFQVYNIELNETCFRFNSGKNYYNNKVEIIKTSRNDLTTGLILFFNIDSFFIEENGDLGFFKAAVYIQNYSTIFRRDQSFNIDSGIKIPAGVTLISMEREFVQKLSKPYNNCVKQDTTDYVSHLFQYFIKNEKIYLQKDCFDLCIEEVMLKHCNCTQELGFLSKCFTDSQNIQNTACIGDLYFSYRNKSLKMPEICTTYCPIECDIINYRKSLNYVGFPPDSLLQKLNISIDIKEKGVYLIFYYPSLQYTLIKQIPKAKTFDLVSNIGGTLGLFIGVSFLSFVEIIEIFLGILFFFI